MHSCFVNVEFNHNWRAAWPKNLSLLFISVKIRKWLFLRSHCAKLLHFTCSLFQDIWKLHELYAIFMHLYHHKTILFLRVSVLSNLLVWVLDGIGIFKYLLLSCLDAFWTRFLIALECDVIDLWSSGVPEFCIRLKVSSFVYYLILALFYSPYLQVPRSCSCALCLFLLFILVLRESHEKLRFNVMFFSSTLSNFLFKPAIWYGLTAEPRSSTKWPNFSLSFMKYRTVMIYNLFIYYFKRNYLHKDDE